MRYRPFLNINIRSGPLYPHYSHATHAKKFMDPRYPHHPRQNFMDPRYPHHPRQNLTLATHAPPNSRTHATHATHEPTPPTRFSRLAKEIH